MNSVLNNLNALNRSLEGVIAVGKEFESVSLLWNNFYDGLARIEIEQQRQVQAEADAQVQAQTAEAQAQASGEADEPAQSADTQEPRDETPSEK